MDWIEKEYNSFLKIWINIVKKMILLVSLQQTIIMSSMHKMWLLEWGAQCKLKMESYGWFYYIYGQTSFMPMKMGFASFLLLVFKSFGMLLLY